MNWIKEAKRVFSIDKPAHFTDPTHCEECAEHDDTLKNGAIDTIGLAELGNPGWDPLCVCSNTGKKYYMPALVRLSIESIREDFYLGQLLFHLEGDGAENSLVRSCSQDQRAFIAAFIAHLIDNHADAIEINGYTDEALKVHRIWSAEKLE